MILFWQNNRLRKRAEPYLLLMPAMVFLGIMSIVPLLYSILLSLRSLVLTRPQTDTFVGFENYISLLNDAKFWLALGRTGYYVLTSVAVSFLLGLGIALLLNIDIKGKFIYRSLLIIPMALPPIVTGFTFRFMYNFDFGIINHFLETIGLAKVPFLATSATSLSSVAVADIWHWTPFMVLVLLAGLEVIPESLYEAGRIDGATKPQLFFHITLPFIRPVILVALLIRMMDAFREFDKIFIMTRGGPGESSETLSLYVWKKGLSFFEISQATAMSIVLLVIILLCSRLLVLVLQKEDLS
jgi:multiple sugar transport system permease protein